MRLRASGVSGLKPHDNSTGSDGVSSADNSLPPSGSTLQRAFEALVSTLNERGVRYAIIGGLATIQHTRVRSTDDIDALVNVPQIALPGLFESLVNRGFTIDLAKSVREFRDDGLTTIRFGDVLVDLMRPVLPAYAHVLERAADAMIFGRKVPVSAAEGLIVMKLIALRPQDEADVLDLLVSYGADIDVGFIRSEIDAVMPADDPRRAKLEALIRKAAGSAP